MTAHGTTSGYRSGCRCEDCKDAKRAQTVARKADARTLEPRTFEFSMSCPYCGGPPAFLAEQRPSPSGTESGAVVKCERAGCRREWHLHLVARSTTGVELELPAVAR
jgi:hypothetical protein